MSGDFTTILFIIIVGILGYIIFSQRKKPDELRERLDTLVSSLLLNVNQRLDAVQKEVGDRLKDNVSFIQRSHQDTARTVGEVQQKLVKLEEAAKQIFDVGKDISSLHDILRAPKLRGGVGEYLLGDLLSQYLPQDNFTLQYTFKNGTKVDAIVKSRDFLIPVDSKFPLENFKRVLEEKDPDAQIKLKKQFSQDVKKHIDDIAKKYILPDEGTSDFAIMYVAAENVYYEMIIRGTDNASLSDYALSKKVVPASPNSFWAYMQAILVGLKGQKVEKNVKEIIQNLSRLRGDFERFGQSFELVGSHLQNARTKYDESEKRFSGIQEKLERIEAREVKELPKRD